MDRMGRTRDKMREAAEAEIRRVSDVLSKLETDLAHAVEHAQQIEDETFDTQEQAAANSRRMESPSRRSSGSSRRSPRLKMTCDAPTRTGSTTPAKVRTITMRTGTPGRP